MKRIFPFILTVVLLAGCEKWKGPGNLEITVSYYYNDFIGYKPDVGAKAYLYSDINASCPDYVSSIIGNAYVGGEEIRNEYFGRADVEGKVLIENIEPGQYYLVLVSEGRFTYSEKYPEIDPGETTRLVKNFYYKHEFEKEPW